MEANEAFRRIVMRHRRLIALLFIIPLVAVVPWRVLRAPAYVATGRIQAQSAAPDVDTQAAAILDRASAVATSPSVVRAAVNAADVTLPRGWVAAHQISATSLGGSAVVVLSVTDPNRAIATSLGRALPGAVVSALNQLSTQQTDPALASLNQQTSQLTAARDALLSQLNASNSKNQSASTAAVGALLAELSAVNAQLAEVSSAQQQLLATASTNGSAGVISLPTNATAVSSGVVTYAVLAGLLGLIIGLLVSTIHEVMKPSIADAGAAARELDVPVLGSLDGIDGALEFADRALLTKIDLAAHRAKVGTVVVTGPLAADELSGLAASLNRQMAVFSLPSDRAALPGVTTAPSPVARSGRVRAQRSDSVPPLNGRAEQATSVTTMPYNPPGGEEGPVLGELCSVALGDLSPGIRLFAPALVVVVRDFAPHRDLDRITDLSATTGWPVLGVIGLGPARRQMSRDRGADPQSTSEQGQQEEGALS